MVATDRISAFDVILPKPIPNKGAVLNQMASFFLDATKNLVPNWLEVVPDPNVSYGKCCQPIPIEMVIRGYLVGHSWRIYSTGEREICGQKMEDGLSEFSRFSEPLITPSTKAQEGHDEDISIAEILEKGIVSKEILKTMVHYSRVLFQKGQEMASEMGLILADTKYEFGLYKGEVVLMDEIHTPDSSRYFKNRGFEELVKHGKKPDQLSKEFVRQWLMENGFMGKEGEVIPDMPEDLVNQISNRYIQLFNSLTGRDPEINSENDIASRIEKNIFGILKRQASVR